MKKLKRFLVIFLISVVAVVILVIVFISPITKYLIEKYDEKYTGRQITLDWAYVNPFTGHIYFKNLKIYEYKSDSIFFSAKSLSVDLSVRKMVSHTYQINSASLDHMYIKVVRDKKVMNFSDIIDKFSTNDSTKAPEKKTTESHVNFFDLKITDAEIHYTDKQVPFDYYIKEANFATPGKWWNQDTMAFTYSFLSGPTRGKMQGRFNMNLKTSDYLLADSIIAFDLKPLEQYVKDLANYGTLRASLDADLVAKGNFHNANNLIATGWVSLSDFHIGKTPGNDYASFEHLDVVINKLSPANTIYSFDSISLIKPYLKYERYDHSDNLEKMFAKKGNAVSTTSENPEKLNIIIVIGKYIKTLASSFFRSSYKVNTLAIINADLKYSDFSLSEEFASGVHGLTITADSINKSKERVNVYLKSGLRPYGDLAIKLSIDPNDSSYYDLNYHINNVPVSMFNPYTVSFTSFPLDRGTLEMNGNWDVLAGHITSRNHLVIVDPRPTKRVRGKDKKWIPLPLIFAFIRERGNVIDYEIPITGSLKDPKFHFHDVIMDLLKNIFVKPVTTPYRFQVKNQEKIVEKYQMIKWQRMSSTLLSSQDKFLTATAEFLSKNKDASIVVEPNDYTTKEKEYITFFAAKKKYVQDQNHMAAGPLSEKDSIFVSKMAIRDDGFMKYLNSRVKDPLLFTLQEKCERLVGSKNIESELSRLHKSRQEVFVNYFKNQHVENRVKILATKSTIPFDGFSYYEIHYKGDLPPDLLNAYDKMNQLNSEDPRKKYAREHKKDVL